MITLLQYHFILSHTNFFTIMIFTIFSKICRKKIFIDGNSHNKITKLRQVSCFCDCLLVSIQVKSTIHKSYLSKTEGHVSQVLNIMVVPVGQLRGGSRICKKGRPRSKRGAGWLI